MGKQKIIRVGNSVAVTIPKEVLNKTGWKPGDEVMVEADRVGEAMGVYTVGSNSRSSADVSAALEKINKRYGPALKKLSQL